MAAIDDLLAQMKGGGEKKEEATAPRVNPPEGDAADVQATVEEVEEKKPEAAKKTRKKKASKKTVNEAEDAAEEPEGFEATIESAGDFGNGMAAALKVEPGTVVPVGGKVRVIPC